MRALTLTCGLLALVVLGTAGCGKGHVFRGVQDAASRDLPCPPEHVEVTEPEWGRFEAKGCGKTARYRWVDGAPVPEDPVPEDPEATD